MTTDLGAENAKADEVITVLYDRSYVKGQDDLTSYN
jgi:hypothetical protein